MPEPVTKEVHFATHAERLDVQAGDRFVMRIEGRISQEQAARIQDTWAAFMAGTEPAPRLLILDGGTSLSTLRDISPAAHAMPAHKPAAISHEFNLL